MEQLPALAALVEWPDADARTAARTRQSRDGLGALGELVEWLAGAQGSFPPRPLSRVRLMRFGIAAGAADALAAEHEVGTQAVDGTSFEDGLRLADAEIDAGADLLLVCGLGDLDACAVAVSAATNSEPVAVLPRGVPAIDTKAWIARAEYVRDRRRAALEVRDRPEELLAAIDSTALSTMCGLIARAVSRRTPLVLDGDLATSAALIAHTAQPRMGSWWRVADSSTSPLQTKALEAFQQRPVLDLRVETSDGTAALLALAVLRTAVALTARRVTP